LIFTPELNKLGLWVFFRSSFCFGFALFSFAVSIERGGLFFFLQGSDFFFMASLLPRLQQLCCFLGNFSISAHPRKLVLVPSVPFGGRRFVFFPLSWAFLFSVHCSSSVYFYSFEFWFVLHPRAARCPVTRESLYSKAFSWCGGRQLQLFVFS